MRRPSYPPSGIFGPTPKRPTGAHVRLLTLWRTYQARKHLRLPISGARASPGQGRDVLLARLVRCRADRPSSIEELVAQVPPHHTHPPAPMARQKRVGFAQPEIRPDEGRFRTTTIKRLMRERGLGGQRREGQFAFGAPITGSYSQKRTFEPEGSCGDHILRCQLYGADPSRFCAQLNPAARTHNAFGAQMPFGRPQKGGGPL